MPYSKPVVAVVVDDEGEQYYINVDYTKDMNPFDVVEQEARERGMRYADTIQIQFPEGRF